MTLEGLAGAVASGAFSGAVVVSVAVLVVVSSVFLSSPELQDDKSISMLAANDVAKNLTCFILRSLNFRNKRSIENGEVSVGCDLFEFGINAAGKYDACLSVHVISLRYIIRSFFQVFSGKSVG
jgi:hypothetical protein